MHEAEEMHQVQIDVDQRGPPLLLMNDMLIPDFLEQRARGIGGGRNVVGHGNRNGEHGRRKLQSMWPL